MPYTQSIYKKEIQLKENHFEISVVASPDEEGWANNCIDAAIAELYRIFFMQSYKEFKTKGKLLAKERANYILQINGVENGFVTC